MRRNANLLILLIKMVPTVGFELTTYRLQGGCSTPELCGHIELARYRDTLRPYGAVERNRTSDLLITNQLLYQLSYNGKGKPGRDRLQGGV